MQGVYLSSLSHTRSLSLYISLDYLTKPARRSKFGERDFLHIVVTKRLSCKERTHFYLDEESGNEIWKISTHTRRHRKEKAKSLSCSLTTPAIWISHTNTHSMDSIFIVSNWKEKIIVICIKKVKKYCRWAMHWCVQKFTVKSFACAEPSTLS